MKSRVRSCVVNAVTLIITAGCVIAVIHGGRHSAGENCGLTTPPDERKKEERERGGGGEGKKVHTRLAYAICFRYIFYGHENPLSTSGR